MMMTISSTIITPETKSITITTVLLLSDDVDRTAEIGISVTKEVATFCSE